MIELLKKKTGGKTEIKEFATHTLFDLEMHLAAANGEIPKTYQKFLGNMQQNRMVPERPVETNAGFKKNQFDIPELLKKSDSI